jgi:YfiH family protein
MDLELIDGMKVCYFETLNKKKVRHFISTRQGGVSKKPYDTLNLAFHVKDSETNVLTNRKRLANALKIDPEAMTLGEQVHSGNVAVVTEQLRGRGANSFDDGIPRTDALVTNVPGICLGVLVADCTPILFFDEEARAIGIAHVGRRGVAENIAVRTIEKMQENFGCLYSNIFVGLGPTIGGKNYAIKKENAEALKSALPPDTKSIVEDRGVFKFDLTCAHKEQLVSAGVPGGHIQESGMCTFENDMLFFSERRDGAPTGRFGAGIMLPL